MSQNHTSLPPQTSNDYLQMIRLQPKSDLHNHAGRGGNKKFLEDFYGTKIPNPPKHFSSLSDMQEWYVKNIRQITQGKEGYLKRWEAAFRQANEDSISVLVLSFDIDEINLMGGMENFISILHCLSSKYAPNTSFLPELSLLRTCNINQTLAILDEILSFNFFKSLDICGNEYAAPIETFIPIYRKAEICGLKLKAHVGEYGSADDIMKAVEILHLSEVHHGIAAVNSPQIMHWLSNHQIQLNICPTSNIMLGLVPSYEKHPIGKLFHAGIPVTINTDDMLIFNQSVSDEYTNLFSSGILSINELEIIRLTGLKK